MRKKRRSASGLEKPEEEAPDDTAGVRRDERDGYSIAQAADMRLRKIDRRDVKDRFARTVNDRRAPPDIAVRSVGLVYAVEYRERARARYRTEKQQLGELFRKSDFAEHGREHVGKVRRRARYAERLDRDHHREQVRENVDSQVDGLPRAVDESAVGLAPPEERQQQYDEEYYGYYVRAHVFFTSAAAAAAARAARRIEGSARFLRGLFVFLPRAESG